MMLDYSSIFNRVKRSFATPEVGDDVSMDPKAILAVTEKLLAVSRGEAQPDERDSLEFRRVHTPDKLFAERIRLDAGKVKRVAMRRVARARTLKPIGINHFDPYCIGLVAGHPLSSPLEEINPLSLVEQSRRVTQMGPGGIPSEDSVTEESQSVSPSIFGFLSSVEGPESGRIGVDARLASGAQVGSDGKIYNQFRNRKTGQKQWLSSEDTSHAVVGLPD